MKDNSSQNIRLLLRKVECEKITFGIGFGIINPTISIQLRKQGLKFNKDKADNFEKMRDCINHLRFGGMLTDSQASTMINKLFNKIEAHVRNQNKLVKI